MAEAHNWIRRLTRCRPLELEAANARGSGELSRSISMFQLVMLGVGSTIGTGIFFALSETVPKAGPAVILSFLIAGFVAGLTALCYAEIAASVPISGSSYSYAYVTMGEGVAFLVAGCLVLEYGISIGAVAVGWSGYLNEAIMIMSRGWLHIPSLLQQSPFVQDPAGTGELSYVLSGSIMNLPAFLLVWICALLLLRGAKESATINAIMVIIKLFVLIMFAAVSLTAFTKENFQPFMPLGVQGVSAAAGIIFFSYVGLDAVATASEEVENPKRSIPLAIILSLIIVTVTYVAVAVTSLGAQPASEFFGQEAGLAEILRNITGTNIWSLVLALGAVISVFSVTLITLYGQTRILFAVSRDGLLPAAFSRVSARTQSPNFNTLAVALFCSLIAGFVPSSLLWGLVSIGTLVAFTAVAVAVIVLRRKRPDLHRSYSVPFYPYLPIASIIACLYVILNLDDLVWLLFLGWLVIGGLYYFLYAARNSALEPR